MSARGFCSYCKKVILCNSLTEITKANNHGALRKEDNKRQQENNNTNNITQNYETLPGDEISLSLLPHLCRCTA